MVKGKRGAELSMNVVIIAIISVLVLVVVAIVFTGGVANAVSKMREFFTIGTEGQTLEFVKQQCSLECDNARISDNPKNSRFCEKTYKVTEGDKVVEYSCWRSEGDVRSAGITCNNICG